MTQTIRSCVASWLLFVSSAAAQAPVVADPVPVVPIEDHRDVPPHAHRGRHREHAPETDLWRDVNSGVSEVFFRFFGNIAPSASGVERPSVDEHMLDAVVMPLDDDERLSFVILGAGNNHMLTSLYFHQSYVGILGLRYGLVPRSASSPFQLSLTASPLHGTLLSVSRHTGIEEPEQDPMPTAVLLGGAVGVDATYTSDVVRLEARAYAMPEVDVGHTHSTGVSQMQSVQVIVRLTEVFHWSRETPVDLYFVGMHIDRGDAGAAVYRWNAQGIRTPGDLREVFQAMAILTLRRD